MLRLMFSSPTPFSPLAVIALVLLGLVHPFRASAYCGTTLANSYCAHPVSEGAARATATMIGTDSTDSPLYDINEIEILASTTPEIAVHHYLDATYTLNAPKRGSLKG